MAFFPGGTRTLVATALLTGSLALSACTSPVQNSAGLPSVDLNPANRGPVTGVGIEGQDILSMTDRMMRDMLSSNILMNRAQPAQIIIDGEYFSNESSQRINKNLIADRLRIGLTRAAQGRLIFVSRQSAEMVERERQLKRTGVTDAGTLMATQGQAGGDFRLRGNIASLDSKDLKTGIAQRYSQITFEVVDLERGLIVWSGIYELSRAAADDVVYR